MAKPLKILVIFSNPIDSSRLRLDKEDRAIDDVVRQYKAYTDIEFVRRHATSSSDLIDLLENGSDFEIIQFSGHGSQEGILLEKPDANEGQLVNADMLSRIFSWSRDKEPDWGPRILIFMSCFSSSSIKAFVNHAPYVITVEDAVSDEGAIVFIKNFYSSYFQERSVQKAFDSANFHLEMLNLKTTVNSIFVKRATYDKEGKLIIEAKISQYSDPIIVDLSLIESVLDRFGMPSEDLLHIIARKIQIHLNIFTTPRENALLPMNSTIIGNFSWDTSANIIICNQLLKFKNDIDTNHWKTWSWILLMCNDLYNEEYRTLKKPVDATTRTKLAGGIKRFSSKYHLIEKSVNNLVKMGFQEAGLSYSLAGSYLDLAKSKFEEEEWAISAAYLESTLSALHDMISSAMPETVDVG